MNFLKRNSTKIFCIGSGKTGTTSLEMALKDFGYKLGDQEKGELLINQYIKRDFGEIIKFCKTANAFQDAPFCFKYTFIALDQSFPNSKFILTLRDNDVQWYQSLKKFHGKLFGRAGRAPTWRDLKEANYRYKGFVYDVRTQIFGIPETNDPFDECLLKAYYNSHNKMVLDYFKHKDNLLVLNLSDKNSYLKLSEYLGKEPLYEHFPWKNRTSDI